MIDLSLELKIIFTIFLVLVGFFRKNSKILWGIQLTWMYILMAFNLDAADYLSNKNIFDTADDSSVFLYSFLANVFKSLELDFFTFNAVLNTFGILCIALFTYKKSKNPCFVTSLILLYPFIDFVVQKRFFIAAVFAFIGLFYFVYAKKPRCYVYLIIVLVAGMFHEAAFLFVVFIVAFWVEKRIHVNSIRWGMALFLCLIFLVGLNIPFFIASLPVVGGERAELYFVILHGNIKYPFLSMILWTTFHLFVVCMVIKFSKIEEINHNYIDERVVALNVVSLILLSLYYWDPVFFRIFRTLMVLDYIYIANILPRNNVYKIPIFIYSSLFVFFIVGLSITIYTVLGLGFDTIVAPVFIDNMIFEL